VDQPALYTLTKSTYMKGIQCPKRLFLYNNHKELSGHDVAAEQAAFEKGINVGLLARQLFPGGKDASLSVTGSYHNAIQQTRQWIKQKEKVIYEAAFLFNKVLVAVDILVHTSGKWTAYEVKSSTEVKEQHIMDAALQYYVMVNSGLVLKDFGIIHINNEYERQHMLDYSGLFQINPVKAEILGQQDLTKNQLIRCQEIVQLKDIPATGIGIHCSDPYACEFTGHCWQHIPEVSVFDLSRLPLNKKFELYNNGISRFDQLAADYVLSPAQALQVKAYLEQYTHIDVPVIRQWLTQLTYPLGFMDFETFMPAVPLYYKSRPYQHIPFQFSVHVQHNAESAVNHEAFLGYPEEDPRQGFIKALIKATATCNTILVYNKAFETCRLKELQQHFPEYSGKIQIILEKIIDLMEPFQKKWYYTASMNGSYSIKVVLPALVPELNYKELSICDGGTAMAAFEGMLNMKDAEEKEKIRTALLEYCKLDTWGMVRILEKLLSI